MKHSSILPGLALATLSLLAAGTPTHAGERPIHAAGRGVLSTYYEYSPQLVGPGKGEHLGPCGLDIYLDWGELYEHGNVVPYFLLIYARNGDVLVATIDSDFDPETGIIAGTITFAGGTGRFADATGSARLRIVPDTSWFDFTYAPFPIDQTRFSWALEGTINY